MTHWPRWLLALAIAVMTVFAGLPAPAGADPGETKLRKAKEHRQEGSKEFRIATVSTRNDMVSGGDVLVRIDVSPRVRLDRVVVELNGADVTGAFKADAASRSLLGLVTGLRVGENRLVAREAGPKGPRAALRMTNYPITGPIISGPHEQPFFCQTSFRLATGALLGPALDEDCSVVTRVDYVYRGTDNRFKPLPTSSPLPADLVFTTTSEGHTVPFIVRVETGTANRAVYELAILHNPAEPTPDPWTRPAGWNGKLIYTHGGGCRSGWYVQGNGTGGVRDAHMLGRGYATASATLNVFGNNCNDLLASETTMMVKERFVERYGPPRFTLGYGSSGGSYQSHQTSDNYPGIFDGILIGHSFPDVTSATIFKLADTRLLEYYFNATAPSLFTPVQQLAVSGFGQIGNIAEQSDGAARIDPDAEFAAAVPVAARYNAVTNPGGARATVYDHTVNVYGRERGTGFALRPLDNVGIQYGLAALNAGVISKELFLDLNGRIGGFDRDLNHVPERHRADPEATRAAYRTGRILNGGGGLASIPIFDTRGYDDDTPADIHMRIHGFSTRARLLRENGHFDNQVMWVAYPVLGHLSTNSFMIRDALRLLDQWVESIRADTSDATQAVKVVRARPPDATDACFTLSNVKIVEPQTYDGPGLCNQLYPSYGTPRTVAGAPLAADIVKCALKPIDWADYSVTFTPTERARLRAIFSEGVCDWTKRGVDQRPLKGTWLTLEAGEDGDDD